jgi:hypothetical protein
LIDLIAGVPMESPPTKLSVNGQHVNKFLGKGLLVALGILSALILQVIIPGFSKTELATIVQENCDRLTKLETLVFQMQDIPRAVYTQTEAIQTLKSSVDKLAEKLDRHIARDTKDSGAAGGTANGAR